MPANKKESIKKIFTFTTTILIGTCDTISSSGLMFYGTKSSLIKYNLTSDLGSIILSAHVSLATATSLTLTRIPALFNLFSFKGTPTPQINSQLSTNEAEPLLANNQIAPLDNIFNSLSGKKKNIIRVFLAFSYLFASGFGIFFIIMQYFGSYNVLIEMGAQNLLSIILSSIFGIGSAISYLAFVFKGGALNNIKYILYRAFSNNNSPNKVLSLKIHHILITSLISFFGAIANSGFNFYMMSSALLFFPLTKNFSATIITILSGTSAATLFFLIFFSYIVDTHKIFGDSFRKLFEQIKNESLGYKVSLFFCSLVFLFDKLAICFIFYQNLATVIKEKLNFSDAASITISIISAISASIIQSFFEYQPTAYNLMKLKRTSCTCHNSCKKRHSPLLFKNTDVEEHTPFTHTSPTQFNP